MSISELYLLCLWIDITLWDHFQVGKFLDLPTQYNPAYSLSFVFAAQSSAVLWSFGSNGLAFKRANHGWGNKHCNAKRCAWHQVYEAKFYGYWFFWCEALLDCSQGLQQILDVAPVHSPCGNLLEKLIKQYKLGHIRQVAICISSPLNSWQSESSNKSLVV